MAAEHRRTWDAGGVRAHVQSSFGQRPAGRIAAWSRVMEIVPDQEDIRQLVAHRWCDSRAQQRTRMASQYSSSVRGLPLRRPHPYQPGSLLRGAIRVGDEVGIYELTSCWWCEEDYHPGSSAVQCPRCGGYTCHRCRLNPKHLEYHSQMENAGLLSSPRALRGR